MTRLYVTRPHQDPLDVDAPVDEIKVLPSGAFHFIEQTPAGPVVRLLAPGRWAEVFVGETDAIDQAAW